MRHPSISRKEGDTLPGKIWDHPSPSKVPRIARRHGCRHRLKIRPPSRAPSTNAKQSTLNKALPHTNLDSLCQHSASFETPRQETDRYFKLLKYERWSRVVHSTHPSMSRQERRHSPREAMGPSAPSMVLRIARHHGCQALPHTDPGSPCQHSASFGNSSTGNRSVLQIVKIERWSRVVLLRHPSISRQERRHTPRENLGSTAPTKVPRIARHHGCRMPVENPPDSQSTSNERETIQLIKAASSHQSKHAVSTQRFI